MTLDHDHHPMNEALYCRSTGRRLAPAHGLEPTSGAPIAVAVLDDGTSLPLFGDAVLGRSPDLDHRVRQGVADALTITDPRRQLSRCHALLRVDRWRVETIDLGSRNGTAVMAADGEWERLLPGIGTPVRDGQQIRLASRILTIFHLQH